MRQTTTFFESLTIYRYRHFFYFIWLPLRLVPNIIIFRIEKPSYQKKMSARITSNVKFRRMPYNLFPFTLHIYLLSLTVSFYRTIIMSSYLFSFNLWIESIDKKKISINADSPPLNFLIRLPRKQILPADFAVGVPILLNI